MLSLGHMVFIVPEKFKKKILPKLVLHRITSMDYTVKKYYCQSYHELSKAGEAEQTADLFIEQTRSCTAEGEPGEENDPHEPGGY